MLGAFKVLARLKGLRGTPLDVFGRTEERRTERALIEEYKTSLEEVLAGLTAENHATALEIARIPEMIKGYGHVKARHLAAARPPVGRVDAVLSYPRIYRPAESRLSPGPLRPRPFPGKPASRQSPRRPLRVNPA